MEKILSRDRPDYIFTYWILIWFFLYIVRIVPYNPEYLFFAGASLGVIQLGIMLAYKKSHAYILSFVLSVMLTKGIPIYFLQGEKTTREDIYAMLSSVVVFFSWLILNGVPIKKFISEYLTPDKTGQISFPVTNCIHQIIFVRG